MYAVYFLTYSNIVAAHTNESMQTYTGQAREGIGSRKLLLWVLFGMSTSLGKRRRYAVESHSWRNNMLFFT